MTNYRNDPIIGTRYFNYRKHGLRKETDNYVKLLIEIGNSYSFLLIGVLSFTKVCEVTATAS